MTESEARLKRCGGPAGCGSVLEPNSGKMHRDDLWDLLKAPNAARYCIASDCMCWRWEEAKPIPNPNGITSNEAPYVKGQPIDGYCGLANKP